MTENIDNSLMQIVPIFPTPMGLFYFPHNLPKKEVMYIKKLKKSNNQGNSRSVDSYILTKTTKLQTIYDFLLKCTRKYFNEIYQPDNNLEIYITQSWCNYNETGQWHHPHSHPNSFISGVFYIECDEKEHLIEFQKNAVYSQIKVNPAKSNEFNSDFWFFPIKPGKLILFPSSLEHSVPINNNLNTRISLSFNTFLKGNIGSEKFLTELKNNNIG